MVKCEFCGKELEPGTGTMFVKDNGKILYFCTSKCEKNTFKLSRKPRNFKYTEISKSERAKKE